MPCYLVGSAPNSFPPLGVAGIVVVMLTDVLADTSGLFICDSFQFLDLSNCLFDLYRAGVYLRLNLDGIDIKFTILEIECLISSKVRMLL